MKKIIISTLFVIIIFSCNNKNSKEIPNEVIVIVELVKNKDKSEEELKSLQRDIVIT